MNVRVRRGDELLAANLGELLELARPYLDLAMSVIDDVQARQRAGVEGELHHEHSTAVDIEIGGGLGLIERLGTYSSMLYNGKSPGHLSGHDETEASE